MRQEQLPDASREKMQNLISLESDLKKFHKNQKSTSEKESTSAGRSKRLPTCLVQSSFILKTGCKTLREVSPNAKMKLQHLQLVLALLMCISKKLSKEVRRKPRLKLFIGLVEMNRLPK